MANHQQQRPLLVLMEDEIIRMDDHPFCSIDPTCDYHEGPELIAEVYQAVEQGLMTSEEATLLIQGKNPLVCVWGKQAVLCAPCMHCGMACDSSLALSRTKGVCFS